MKIRVSCQDKYEAQKLSSLLFIKNSKESFMTGILNIVDNELVVSLKDKSAHSIMLKTSEEGEALADFLQSVFENKHKITGTNISDEQIEITKE